MIRRYLLPLLLLLPFLTLTAHAETIPATKTTYSTAPVQCWNYVNSNTCGTSPITGSTAAELCSTYWTKNNWTTGANVVVSADKTSVNCGTYSGNYRYGYKICPTTHGASAASVGATPSETQCFKAEVSYICPSEGGWTLTGQTCTRPDCPNNDPRNADGTCQSACQQVAALMNGQTAWYTVPVGSGQAMGSYCDSGCAVSLGVAGTGYYTDGKNNSFQRTKHYSGSSCTSEPNAPAQFNPEKPKPPVPEKKPPCAAGEGVMTSSSGTIGCVPEGTPNSNPPVVKKEKSTTTNPDNTTTTTETTTTRDPSTGVEQKSTSTTNCSGPNCTTTTTNGTSGSTTGGNPEKPGDSDFCQKNPTLDICTGKLNKEETQKKIADDIKSLTNPGDTSTDPLKNATHTTESENQLKTENDKFTDAAKGITDPTAASKSSWQQAMESGWFSAIPSSGCTPISGTVGGRQFTIDHCEKASQISDIMSYALWFMLVVGSFVMFTGGQVRSQ